MDDEIIPVVDLVDDSPIQIVEELPDSTTTPLPNTNKPSGKRPAPLRISLFDGSDDDDDEVYPVPLTNHKRDRPTQQSKYNNEDSDEESDQEILERLRNTTTSTPVTKRPRVTRTQLSTPITTFPKPPTSVSEAVSEDDDDDNDDYPNSNSQSSDEITPNIKVDNDGVIDIDDNDNNHVHHPESSLSIREVSDLLELNHVSSDATSELPTPVEMNVLLLRHQRQALKWMVNRESPNQRAGVPRGGILADDQGFGKTLTLIALILTNRPEQLQKTSTRSTPWRNLIIAPNSILHQWAAEIENRIDSVYRPKILVYHGPNRPKDARTLASYDIVITSYGTLRQDYKLILKSVPLDVDPSFFKSKPRRLGPLFKVKWFRVVLDEAQAIKNFRGDSFHAASELRTERRWSLTGTPIQNSLDDIYSQFLFLGYHVVASHKEWVQKYRRPMEKGTNPLRRKKHFERFQAILGVVLLRRAKHDRIEGKPVMTLPPKRITVKELEFSRTERAYYQATEVHSVQYFNKRSNEAETSQTMAIVLVILMKLRMACGHPALCEWGHLDGFRFSDEELDVAELRLQTRALISLFTEEVQSRLKMEFDPDTSQAPIITCPICIEVIDSDGVVTRCGHIFCKSDFEGWSSQNSSCPTCRNHVAGESDAIPLTELIREIHAVARKQKRDLGLLPPQEEKEEKHEKKKLKKEKRKDENQIILFPQDNDASLPSASQDDPSDRSDDESDLEKENKDSLETSTKIRGFMEDFKKIIETTNDKVLCFSQWIRMLDLMEIPLRQAGYEFVRLDGTMSVDDRQAAVRTFNTRSKCRLFLISLSAGSTGLNLTVANRVYLMDSWWNPAVEDQAIDRVHRIGQKKDVEVVRMKIKDTIEDKILKLQEKKRALMDGALGVEGLKTVGRRRLTLQDLTGLFSDVAENVAARADGEQNDALAQLARNMMDISRMGAFM